MEKNVVISIKGKQKYIGMPEDCVELITKGKLTDDGAGGYLLSYQESELTGMEGTSTTFNIKPGYVSLQRTGSVANEMVFEEGRRHSSIYETPYGRLEVDVNARKIRSSIGANGGDLDIVYTMEFDHNLAGTNLFHMNVREERGRN